ncbi:1-methyladenosine methyltransferase catalytic subunit Gcd14 [Cokeromyces recurvatus]|uniref:1-methyladenosine methyltransferase catalytic subunit Gcd14 n=1 Tax=Cokeromyces recurvatus TaxID=90255 RepID=UPI002220F61D|nr:1-methyladenosine methyltransferase catalytic subunit Gcd14 [Cokeromyces recurvatus]KAI7905149.1 1-methyladenosine methyltransferase catalytic subunit Gcd14 [Cokeromyces recurvatus]
MVSSNYKGFVYLLHPTPELWTQVLPHRTQILYIADISFISTQLELKPGVKMIESGTGSGSFSHSIARTIAPTGKLYSFEYHEERANLAQKEFEEHGLGDVIKMHHRDVCKDGFQLKDEVNAVFLDLPAPWDAIASAKEAFKQDRTGKICCFSPCIEQVARTVAALEEYGFIEITMYECLIREHTVSPLQKVEFSTAIKEAKERRAQGLPTSENSSIKRKFGKDEPTPLPEEIEQTANLMLVSKTLGETRGHTSYLTFATFLPPTASDVVTNNSSDSN